ncbi:MAG: AraC family transcriptional regulator [Pseudomonadota bacterium]
MSIIVPEFEYVDRTTDTIRYLEHGWPTDLCRWHSHPEYELHLIVETRGRAFVGDYIGEFGPGSLYMTGPHLPHNWITDEVAHPKPAPIRDMLVQFSQESVEQLSAAFPEFREMDAMFELAKSGIEFTGFDPIFARGHMERIRNTRGSERIVAFLRFLVRVCEHAEKRVLSVPGLVASEGNSKQARIAKVVDFITEHYADEISVEIVSDMAGMSRPAFARNFQRITGNRFVEFVNRVRVSQACSMLYSTDEQVSSICFAVGFQNLANFNRHFLKLKGMTPKEFRETALRDLAPKERMSA